MCFCAHLCNWLNVQMFWTKVVEQDKTHILSAIYVFHKLSGFEFVEEGNDYVKIIKTVFHNFFNPRTKEILKLCRESC